MTEANETEKYEFLCVHEDTVREVLDKMPDEDML